MQNKTTYFIFLSGKCFEFCIVSKHFWGHWNGSVSYYNGIISNGLAKLHASDKEIPNTDSAMFAKGWLAYLPHTEIMEARCSGVLSRSVQNNSWLFNNTSAVCNKGWYLCSDNEQSLKISSIKLKKKGSFFGTLLFPSSSWDCQGDFTKGWSLVGAYRAGDISSLQSLLRLSLSFRLWTNVYMKKNALVLGTKPTEKLMWRYLWSFSWCS